MTPLPRRIMQVCAVLGVVVLSACAGQQPDAQTSRGTFDPYEEQNRQVHAFNKDLDRKLVRPVAKGYDAAVPDDIETVILRFSDNTSLPGAIVNNILQLNMRAAIQDTARLVVNTTVGLGGFFDPATEMGMPAASDADFGQTLHVWGAGEGAYIELPVLGPSTQRDTFGTVVDVFIDPLTYVLGDPEAGINRGASVAGGLTRRSRFSGTIDQILYESADSYAQSRSFYLQSRRFELGGTASETYTDPYGSDAATAGMEDPYDE
ncbi:MlaA family lipoprotein [Roseovarius sp. D22-M7]|uniref:MlaA family lipoprotein n=1 Tax=Roseovarius sp. D22-M7 TaxID=3127116 RepID=UPI00300F7C5B